MALGTGLGAIGVKPPVPVARPMTKRVSPSAAISGARSLRNAPSRRRPPAGEATSCASRPKVIRTTVPSLSGVPVASLKRPRSPAKTTIGPGTIATRPRVPPVAFVGVQLPRAVPLASRSTIVPAGSPPVQATVTAVTSKPSPLPASGCSPAPSRTVATVSGAAPAARTTEALRPAAHGAPDGAATTESASGTGRGLGVTTALLEGLAEGLALSLGAGVPPPQAASRRATKSKPRRCIPETIDRPAAGSRRRDVGQSVSTMTVEKRSMRASMVAASTPSRRRARVMSV